MTHTTDTMTLQDYRSQLTEGDVKRTAADYLQTLWNQGKVVWVCRLNSGAAFQVYRDRQGQEHKHRFDLCPQGTPDYMVVLPHCTVWLELKRPKGGRLSAAQRGFAERIGQCPGHRYCRITSFEQLQKVMDDAIRS